VDSRQQVVLQLGVGRATNNFSLYKIGLLRNGTFTDGWKCSVSWDIMDYNNPRRENSSMGTHVCGSRFTEKFDSCFLQIVVENELQFHLKSKM
jgi:hypothetical protein